MYTPISSKIDSLNVCTIIIFTDVLVKVSTALTVEHIFDIDMNLEFLSQIRIAGNNLLFFKKKVLICHFNQSIILFGYKALPVIWISVEVCFGYRVERFWKAPGATSVLHEDAERLSKLRMTLQKLRKKIEFNVRLS